MIMDSVRQNAPISFKSCIISVKIYVNLSHKLRIAQVFTILRDSTL